MLGILNLLVDILASHVSVRMIRMIRGRGFTDGKSDRGMEEEAWNVRPSTDIRLHDPRLALKTLNAMHLPLKEN